MQYREALHIPLSLRIVKKKRTGSIYSPKISTWLKHGYICRSSPDCYIDITIYMDIASNPGPTTTHDLHAGNDQNSNRYNILCLYFNARSLSNKTKELETLASNIDIIAVTETWLKPDILNCELLTRKRLCYSPSRQSWKERGWSNVSCQKHHA